MKGAEKTEIFSVGAEQIFKVLTDYEQYADFMDGVSSVEVVSRGENKAIVKYNLNMIKKFTYTIEITEDAPNKLSWTFVEGDLFKTNNGSWTLKDLGSGETEVTYALEVEFKVKVPGMISRKLVSSNLPSMMKSVEKRAKSQ